MNKIVNSFIKHRWLRYFVPIVFIVIWLIVSGIGGPTFGKLGSVESNDQASFLPASSESTEVAQAQKQFQNGDTIPAVVLITSPGQLSSQQLQKLAQLQPKISAQDNVATINNAVVGPIPSQDGKAVEFLVQLKSSVETKTSVANLQNLLDKNIDSSLTSYVTGPAGLSAALVDAFGGIDGILLLVALAAVFVILLLVYRSIILPIIVLLTAIFALSGAILVIYYLALHDIIALNGQAQGILSILVIGAATDYSLLLIARYRENLRHIESKWKAIWQSLKVAFEPIAASAATVILALLCLLFSDLRSNQSVGPVAAIGIAFAFIAAMTFLPSLLALFGRAAFWPARPKLETADASEKRSVRTGLWARVASFVGKSHRPVWIISTVVLVIFAFGLTQLKATGVSTSDTILKKSAAIKGQQKLAEHFPAGSGAPAVILVPESQSQQTIQLVKKQAGLKNVSFYTGKSPFAMAPPIVKNGNVLIDATLTDSPSSDVAEQTIKDLRSIFDKNNLDAKVGGQTAVMLDTNKTARRDLFTIIPIVLVVVVIILALLLRSILAPILLVASVVLSFAATLGISALVFNHVFGFAGADPSVPLFGFIFLVALGIDYNIFLMSRVREESKRIGTRKGILHGLEATGGVITSAGVVLAATFAALGVIPILFLAEIAFIVAFGVLLDTIIVRSLLIPGVSYDIGRFIWWPSKLRKKE